MKRNTLPLALLNDAIDASIDRLMDFCFGFCSFVMLMALLEHITDFQRVMSRNILSPAIPTHPAPRFISYIAPLRSPAATNLTCQLVICHSLFILLPGKIKVDTNKISGQRK